MRGSDGRTRSLFSYVDLEARVPADHPLRVIRTIADEALAGMSTRFDACYARCGRYSCGRSIRSASRWRRAFGTTRQLMERLEFDLLFRWFVGLGIDNRVWDASTFSKNRDRLLEADAAAEFLSGVVRHPQVRRQIGREHLSVDGTLIDAWASMKSSGQRSRPIRMAVTVTTAAGATSPATGAVSGGRTRPTLRPPIRMPGSTRRRPARRAGSASWPRREHQWRGG
jgi:transposase